MKTITAVIWTPKGLETATGTKEEVEARIDGIKLYAPGPDGLPMMTLIGGWPIEGAKVRQGTVIVMPTAAAAPKAERPPRRVSHPCGIAGCALGRRRRTFRVAPFTADLCPAHFDEAGEAKTMEERTAFAAKLSAAQSS
jgi:hypothetical protein